MNGGLALWLKPDNLRPTPTPQPRHDACARTHAEMLCDDEVLASEAAAHTAEGGQGEVSQSDDADAPAGEKQPPSLSDGSADRSRAKKAVLAFACV